MAKVLRFPRHGYDQAVTRERRTAEDTRDQGLITLRRVCLGSFFVMIIFYMLNLSFLSTLSAIGFGVLTQQFRVRRYKSRIAEMREAFHQQALEPEPEEHPPSPPQTPQAA